MIAALAKAGRVFDEEEAIHMAKQAMSFLETHLVQHERLMVRYREGDVKHLGFIEDYAHMLKAYMSLYEATFELDWLEKPQPLPRTCLSCFGTRKKGLFFSGSDAEALIVREKSVRRCHAFWQQHCTQAPSHAKQTDRTSGLARHITADVPSLLCRCLFLPKRTHSVSARAPKSICNQEKSSFSEKRRPSKEQLLQALQKRFVPFDIILTAETGKELAKLAPFTKDYKTIDGKTTVYICENYSCRQPITDIDEAMEQLFPD